MGMGVTTDVVVRLKNCDLVFAGELPGGDVTGYSCTYNGDLHIDGTA